MKPNLLVITPIRHINGVCEILDSFANVTYLEDPDPQDLSSHLKKCDIIFTNPNKSKIFIGKDIIDRANNLSTICTASTGTNHIDVEYLKQKNIKLISLTEERSVINRISSTAEHAFALTLSAIRNIPESHKHVLNGGWDYEKFIGRQLNRLKIGIVGFGRLGGMYSSFCIPFGSQIIAYDPFKKINNENIIQAQGIEELLNQCDIISFHVHVTDDTKNMVNKNWFNLMKKDVVLVNTSRGDIIDEGDLIKFLRKNYKAKYATDVLANEITKKFDSKLIEYAKVNNQVIITPHIGGMTREAQEIAYNHAAELCKRHFHS